MSQDKRARLRENFKRGRDLLLKRGVPFEPEELLDPQWQRKLRSKLAQIPELNTLAELSVESIDLDYKLSKKTDQHGNQFRYRAKVRDTQHSKVGRWAWDVFLVSAP